MKRSAQKFFNKAIANNQNPRIINIDKSGSNFTTIRARPLVPELSVGITFFDFDLGGKIHLASYVRIWSKLIL